MKSEPQSVLSFDNWCRALGSRVVKTAIESLEKGNHPSDEDLAAIIRDACNDFIADKVYLNLTDKP
jgi:hypothetical protein